ncbi:MAG: DUF2007 domain-containing protein [Candidatus Acidiferrum sp.]
MTELESNPQNQRLVVLRQIRDLPEALLAKSILDSAGIDCFIGDQNTIRMDWLWSNLLGGFKLWVRQEDADAASELLNQPISGNFNVEGVGEFEQPRCPMCQSLDIQFEGINKRAAHASIIVGVPATFEVNRWQCHDCKHQWTDDSSPTA